MSVRCPSWLCTISLTCADSDFGSAQPPWVSRSNTPSPHKPPPTVTTRTVTSTHQRCRNTTDPHRANTTPPEMPTMCAGRSAGKRRLLKSKVPAVNTVYKLGESSMTEPTRRDRGREDTDREIRGRARALLVEHGHQAVTLRAIARDLGITAPALYRYYSSREDLMQHLRQDTCADAAAERAG